MGLEDCKQSEGLGHSRVVIWLVCITSAMSFGEAIRFQHLAATARVGFRGWADKKLPLCMFEHWQVILSQMHL